MKISSASGEPEAKGIAMSTPVPPRPETPADKGGAKGSKGSNGSAPHGAVPVVQAGSAPVPSSRKVLTMKKPLRVGEIAIERFIQGVAFVSLLFIALISRPAVITFSVSAFVTGRICRFDFRQIRIIFS